MSNAQNQEKQSSNFFNFINNNNKMISMKILHHPFLFLLLLIIPQFSCQFTSPQNIQTFYPFPPPPPNPTPNPPLSPPLSPSPSPSPTQPLPNTTTRSTSSSSRKAVGTAIGVTAASSLVLSGLFFFFLIRRSRRRKQILRDNPYKNPYENSNPPPPPPPVVQVQQTDFVRFNGNVKGLIVDEDGLDVLYWRKLQDENGKQTEFEKKEVFKNIKKNEEIEEEEEKQIIQELPLLIGSSSTSHSSIWNDIPKSNSNSNSFKALEKQGSLIRVEKRSPPPPPLPPPPPIQSRKLAPPPPPLPKESSLASSSSKPPPVPPKGLAMGSISKKEDETLKEGDGGQVKLKPLHWDKVNPNLANHSMVWDKIEGGSFKFDDNLMEALFGTVATSRKSPRSSNATTYKGEQSGPPSQIFLLDTRKSQNIAIVLKSLALSRKDIIDALIKGKGLNADTLEKLTKIAPTKEEESVILAFDGDPTRLADAESFLYHLLKSVPSAFTRFGAMLFRYNYDHEVLQFKESYQTLELGCKELRARGLLLKLLEAILKAGNRMNAGTSRGNAQAFKLTALRKLSDVKSTDGKTSLLHFVVEEVVRAEGKRCFLNRNRSLSHSSSNFGSSTNLENSHSDREKEYIMHGLPIVGGLSSEFSNVKKAAGVDYEVLDKSSKELTSQIAEIRKLLLKSGGDQEGGFAKEMKIFLGSAEKEMKMLKEEQNRVMDIVKRTTDYYQAGAISLSSSNDHNNQNWKQPLQLFVIVKDFLEMVDRACVDIARNFQKRKPLSRSEESSSSASASSGAAPGSPKNRPSVKFPKLPPNFLSDQINSTSSGSDQDS